MSQQNLANLLFEAAIDHQDRPAIGGEGVELSYEQLLSQAQQVASMLKQSGLQPNDPVMVKCSNHPLDFVAFFGVWLASGVVAPVHRVTPDSVVQGMQAKAECRFSIDMLQQPVRVQIVAAASGQASDQASRRAMLENAALIIFTSGSTGMPKAAVLSHEAFMGKLAQNQDLLKLCADTVTMMVLNNTFSFGIWVALLTLKSGGRLHTRSKFVPEQFWEDLVDHKISFLAVVPTMIRATFSALDERKVEHARQRLAQQACLKSVVIGGEYLGAELSKSLRALIQPAELFDIYGLTETATCDFVLKPQDYLSHEGSIGKPFPAIQYRLMNIGKECAVGEPGELQLKTPYLMKGYLGDPQLSQAAFEDGWFRTGDLAVRDHDGYVSIVGRLKDIIVRGGNKITPVEVERALANCRGVAAAMVIGVPDPVMGQHIQALLVPKLGVELNAQDVRAELSDLLERFKHPDMCFVGTELPTGRTGKVDRAALASWVQTQQVQPLASWAN